MSEGQWQSLSMLVRELCELAAAKPLRSTMSSEAAAELALMRFGADTVMEVPSIVNAAALALAMGQRPVLHLLRPAVTRMVAETDLHSLPGEPPRLLRRAWLLEVRRPETGDRLFGSTVSMGGYQLDGATYLVGLQYPDGAMVARWRPQWGAAELEAGVVVDRSPLIDDVDAHHEWSREAARFAVVAGLLLDAEAAPLRREEEREPAIKGSARGGAPPAPWVTRHIYLDEVYSGGRSNSPGAATMDEEGRLPEEVMVKGHLKRQHYGAGNALVKWLYVASYEARRWVAPRPVKIVVDR